MKTVLIFLVSIYMNGAIAESMIAPSELIKGKWISSEVSESGTPTDEMIDLTEDGVFSVYKICRFSRLDKGHKLHWSSDLIVKVTAQARFDDINRTLTLGRFQESAAYSEATVHGELKHVFCGIGANGSEVTMRFNLNGDGQLELRDPQTNQLLSTYQPYNL